ncbi:MAG TPA: histidine phosphatase family protein [Rhizomicrobium sp.]|nr:histidine phosphatase family protein [Rhizomicrobium sp.]
MRIALLRHGPTEWNARHLIQGQTDIPLSEEGLRQMRGLRVPFAAQRVFSSPMKRTQQTAKAMGLENPILDARLMEQHWGRWEGLSLQAITDQEGKDAFLRAGRKTEFRPPGGESTQELMDRVAAFLRDAAKEESDAVAVAHLGVLRAAYTLATGWNMATPMPAELDVSKILVLELDATGKSGIHTLNLDFVAA